MKISAIKSLLVAKASLVSITSEDQQIVPKFSGVVKLDVRDSKPDWAPYIGKKAPVGSATHSRVGSPSGSVNENKFFNEYPDELSENMKLINEFGGHSLFIKDHKLYKSPGDFKGGTIAFVTISTGKEKYCDL